MSVLYNFISLAHLMERINFCYNENEAIEKVHLFRLKSRAQLVGNGSHSHQWDVLLNTCAKDHVPVT